MLSLVLLKLTSLTMQADCNILILFFLQFLFITCQLFFLSKSFIAKINAIIRKFWWAGIQVENPSNPMAYRSWDDICKPKAQGGLGIRDMELINKSLIIHSAWNVATHKNPFLSNILKAKYYTNSTFWIASTTGPRSIFWSCVLQVKQYLHDNSILQIHARNSSIWSSPWIYSWSTIHDNILLPVTNIPMPSFVSDLWLQGTQSWNEERGPPFHHFYSTHSPKYNHNHSCTLLNSRYSKMETCNQWKWYLQSHLYTPVTSAAPHSTHYRF
jgi:hypothetical protein